MFSWCSAHTGHTGAAQGCMSVGASYSQRLASWNPEEWEGFATPRPNLFSRHFLCKTRWAWKQLGECGKFSKGNKIADLRPLAVLQVPPHCSEVGETRVQEVKPLAQGHQITKLPVQFSLQALLAFLSGTSLHGWVSEGGGRNSLCVSQDPLSGRRQGDYRVTWKAISATLDRGVRQEGRVHKQVRRWETGWNPGGHHGGGGNACTWPWGGGGAEVDSVEQWGGWALLVAQWLKQRQGDRPCGAEVSVCSLFGKLAGSLRSVQAAFGTGGWRGFGICLNSKSC